MKTQTPLASQLEAQKNKIINSLSPETVEILLNTSQKLTESGITDNSLQVGATAPDF